MNQEDEARIINLEKKMINMVDECELVITISKNVIKSCYGRHRLYSVVAGMLGGWFASCLINALSK